MLQVQIDKTMLARVSNTIAKYCLFDGERNIIVAFSGGKDSSCTSQLLSALGFSVRLVAIDMGYSPQWASRIQSLAKQLSLACDVLAVRDKAFQDELETQTQEAVRQRLVILDKMSDCVPLAVSPCTQCYNTKIEVLRDYMSRSGRQWIAFGHHATDAIASLIKSALMYIDRWDRAHEVWARANFEVLIDDLNKELNARVTVGSLIDRIVNLADAGYAATDEPPVQPLHHKIPGRRLVRPMFEVFEHEILDIARYLRLHTEPSGCGHGATHETETPREMVHHRILVPLSKSDRGREWLRFFMQVARSGLREEGELNVNTRSLREQMLGARYRSGIGADIKL